jgi:hypothetical protein
MPTEQQTEHQHIHENRQPENLNLKNIKSNILKLFICKYISTRNAVKERTI